jgi:zinc protease
LGQTPKALVDLTFHGSFDYQPEQRYRFSSLLALLRIQLREQLREALGAVYTVRVNGNNSRYPQQQYKITISFNCDPGLVDTLLHHTALIIRQVQEQGPSASDLQKIKETQLQARQKAEQENRFWMAQLRYRYQNDFPLSGASTAAFRQRVTQLSAHDLQEAARQYFDFEQRINLVLLPEQ